MPEEKYSILIVDDEAVVRNSLLHWFGEEGYDTDSAADAGEALSKLGGREFDLVVADIRMPGMDGLELLERIRAEDLDTTVILITGYASVDSAVRAFRHGAFDYLPKPFDPDELSAVVRSALEKHRLKRENRLLRAQLAECEGISELVGQSEPMRKVRDQIETVAGVDSTVLIQGESGSGKELVARAIHRLSPRRLQPMVVVHCASLTETLIESELFGHEKGAFTGAQYRKKGKFEAAHGGTIFLDEIADISLKTQTDLLRVLQEREIVRVGSNQPIRVDFRVIAATNRSLAELVREGLFRSDLYYRLNVFSIQVPPLRERHGDIPLLATFFLEKYCRQMNRRFTSFARGALERLSSYHWPGNVRELENVIERAVVVGREPAIRVQDLAIGKPSEHPEDLTLEAVERRHVERVLEEFGWNQTQAAKALGIDRVTLYHKIRRYGLRQPSKETRQPNGAQV